MNLQEMIKRREYLFKMMNKYCRYQYPSIHSMFLEEYNSLKTKIKVIAEAKSH